MTGSRRSAPASSGRPVPTDPRAESPLFYFRYAPRGIGQRRADVARFFADLSENVSSLVLLAPGRGPGFIDSEPQNGFRSSRRAAALGTCQVFVALLSADYLKNQLCGKEWDAFAQREVREHGFSGHHTVGMSCIIPVIWAPFPSDRLPRAVASVQWFSPRDLPEQATSDHYHAGGISGLMLAGPEPAYRAVTWELAKRIAEIQARYEVEPRVIDYAGLRGTFRKPGD